MKSKPPSQKSLFSLPFRALAFNMLVVAGSASAAQLDISNVPLFAAINAPPPNIMFVFDDSGSMDFDMVGSQNTGSDGQISIPNCGSFYRSLGTPYDYTGSSNFDSTNNRYAYANSFPAAPPHEDGTSRGFWRVRNKDFNPMFYNPSVTYFPWFGVDSAGNQYGNANPTNPRFEPYLSNSHTIDLTRTYQYGAGQCNSNNQYLASIPPSRYWRWTDTDNDGLVDANDGHTAVVIATASDSDFDNIAGEDRTGRSDCANAESNSCTQAEELQNFANWFQYYRRREYTAKAAYTNVVFKADSVNMGLVTLHNNNNVKNTLSYMSFDSNKNSLLDSLVRINSDGGTPLRSTMYEAGQYLACDDTSTIGSCPRAPADEGGACQQNFMVAMTDGYYNGGFNMPGSGDNEDGNGDTNFDGGPYADNYSNTLADIAMEFYENDIHPESSYPNVLPVIPGVDEARHQHVTTYTVAFGVNGTLNSMPGPNVNGSGFWPDPFSGDLQKIDDLRHAAFNGRGLFLSARSPNELVTALSDAILSIGDRASSAAAVALNSSSLNSGSQIFQARFDSGDWSGQLLSYPVYSGAPNGLCGSSGVGEICSLKWDAGEVLKGQNWSNGREIITTDNSDSAGAGIPFQWSDLNNSQKIDLRTHPDDVGRNDPDLSNNNGRRILEFIRGREYVNHSFIRERSGPLGDIVNSDPYFIRYSASLGVVFVGANDGMLHAFRESNGQELFAFIPGDRRIWDNLSILASKSYKTKHRYFVDGSPTVIEGVTVDGTGGQKILVSGLRAGGQSVFALNVTNPANFSEGNADALVEWEFTDLNDAQLGYTYSQPSIVKMANGKWAAVIGNGYNNSESDGASGNGKGSLFILFLDGPTGSGTWTQGTHYRRIDVNYGTSGTPNGLGTPAPIDTNHDGVVDYIYAGDLGGNMWRFNVSSANPGDWAVGFSGNPLFVARDSSNNRQPITVRPEVGPHYGGIDEGVVVLFGTGKYIENSDNSGSGQQDQTFYGIWDQLDGGTAVAGRSDLQQQTIVDEVGSNCSNENPCFRLVSQTPVELKTGSGGKRGWYVDLVSPDAGSNQGERAVSNPILRSGRIIFTTLIPSGSQCDFGGDGWLMELDMFTGGAPYDPTLDTNGDDVIDQSDIINGSVPAGIQYGNGIMARPTVLSIPPSGAGSGPTSGFEKKQISTSQGVIDAVGETGAPEKRRTWREIR